MQQLQVRSILTITPRPRPQRHMTLDIRRITHAGPPFNLTIRLWLCLLGGIPCPQLLPTALKALRLPGLLPMVLDLDLGLQHREATTWVALASSIPILGLDP